MTTSGALFLDFDDTLVDFSAFMIAWVRAIGDVAMHRLGGESRFWSDAAVEILGRLEAEYRALFVGNPLAGYRQWLHEVRGREARAALAQAGLPATDENVAIIIDAFQRSLLSVGTPIAGALELLDTLDKMPVGIHLASGQDSDHLLYALRGLGVRDFAGYRFGPDLIDCAKEGPEYYERCFALSAAVQPWIVVDNQPESLEWAIAAGATAIHSCVLPDTDCSSPDGVAASITDLAQLPSLIDAILSDGQCRAHRQPG
ncbi:MAG: hypothetical protein KGJ62_08325 [Armatimonadetes bacterium]|nr:hypothetical protein [Armatimonadota bacterium]MDE2207541.1 hypothetical protein [Armatimonadota bacterium]